MNTLNRRRYLVEGLDANKNVIMIWQDHPPNDLGTGPSKIIQ